MTLDYLFQSVVGVVHEAVGVRLGVSGVHRAVVVSVEEEVALQEDLEIEVEEGAVVEGLSVGEGLSVVEAIVVVVVAEDTKTINSEVVRFFSPRIIGN